MEQASWPVVLTSGQRLCREADDVAARLPNVNLAHAIERGPLRQHHVDSTHAPQQIVEILHFNVRPRCRVMGEYWSDLHGPMLRRRARLGIRKNGRVLGGRHPIELSKFVYKMRMIVVAVVQREVRPIRGSARHIVRGIPEAHDTVDRYSRPEKLYGRCRSDVRSHQKYST